MVAMEVSSHALDQHRVAAVRFHTAVFTQLTRDHLDYHGSMSAYAAAKARLFRWERLAARVINIDDALGEELARARLGCAPHRHHAQGARRRQRRCGILRARRARARAAYGP